MNKVARRIFITLWTILAFLLPYGILRIMTSASSFDFSGHGTLIYLLATAIYIVVTIILIWKYSKNFAYFLLLLVALIIFYPFLLVFLLNHFIF